MGVTVMELDNADAYAALAWLELVDVAEKELPLLSTERGRYVSGAAVKGVLYHAKAQEDNPDR